MRRSLLALLPLLSCQDYLFDQVCPEAIRESSIEMPAAEPTPADILFVVDNSGSMADEQENLATNFGRFINQIAGAGDYHIAVVTTDQQTPTGEQQGLVDYLFSPTFPNRVLGLDPSTDCMPVSPPIQHGCFRGSNPATRIVDSSTMDAMTQVNVFSQNVRVGSCGSGEEQGLRAALSALNQRTGCNSGFLRDNANLVIIIVSDEEDDDGTDVRDYVEQLKAIKPAAQIRVAMIVGFADGEANNCSIQQGADCGSLCQNMPPPSSNQACTSDPQCPGDEECNESQNTCVNPDLINWNFCFWCSYYETSDCCSAIGGSRYVDFALRMEAEIIRADSGISDTNCQAMPGVRSACRIATICQDNFGDTLAEIARDLVITNTYNLNPPAKYPPGVSVTVKNGRFGAEGKKLVYNTDFSVSADGSVLTLMGENSPTEGEDIEIHFVVDSENRVEAPRGACQVSGSP